MRWSGTFSHCGGRFPKEWSSLSLLPDPGVLAASHAWPGHCCSHAIQSEPSSSAAIYLKFVVVEQNQL